MPSTRSGPNVFANMSSLTRPFCTPATHAGSRRRRASHAAVNWCAFGGEEDALAAHQLQWIVGDGDHASASGRRSDRHLQLAGACQASLRRCWVLPRGVETSDVFGRVTPTLCQLELALAPT